MDLSKKTADSMLEHWNVVRCPLNALRTTVSSGRVKDRHFCMPADERNNRLTTLEQCFRGRRENFDATSHMRRLLLTASGSHSVNSQGEHRRRGQ
jgi:hypothetical protein